MVIYIKELDKNDKLGKLDKFSNWIKKTVIKIIEITNNFIEIELENKNRKYILPNVNNKKVYKKVIKKIKLQKKVSKEKIEIVLSENLKKYKNEFKNFSIINGNNLLLKNVDKVVKRIIGNLNIEEQQVYILANGYTQTNVNFIKDMSLKVKNVNVITNQIQKYSMLEEMMMKNKGIAITCANNKKKSLKKAKIIINLDFSIDNIKKYNIFRNACIINVLNEITLKGLSGFEGIIVQNIEPELKEDELYFFENNNLINNFKKIELYESINKNNDNINILSLYGNNGEIDKKELLNLQKILTN